MPSKFDEIRPYNDSDLPHVVKELVNNKAFIRTLVGFRFGKYPQFVKPIIGWFIKRLIAKKLDSVTSLAGFQVLVEPYMERMIKNTTTALSTTGLDTLDLSKPCLFISNHRDIALDPAFVNWALHMNGQDTVRIAVGDNLLKHDWVADILRLNKCFVVQRSVEGRREKLAAAKLLSEYIHHSLKHDKNHIWIAQREGRAKNGIDITNPAIISMLTLNKPKETNFADYIADLRIIPVSISYEFDPCDVSKAKELYKADKEGTYNKPDNEDMKSIVNGIQGNKGKVNVHFGKLAGSQFENVKAVASFIDDEILTGYQTFSTSHVAIEQLGLEQKDTPIDTQHIDITSKKKATRYLESRLSPLNKEEQKILLEMYANPLIRKLDKAGEGA
jgi:hypothetical protein